jgi:hypothetical protein
MLAVAQFQRSPDCPVFHQPTRSRPGTRTLQDSLFNIVIVPVNIACSFTICPTHHIITSAEYLPTVNKGSLINTE